MPMSLIFRGVGLLVGNLIYLGWRLHDERIGLKFNLKNIFSLVNLISYTFLARVGSIVTNNIDSFIAARFIGVEVVPALTFTRRIPEISKPFVERPIIAFMPSISHLIGAGEIDKAREVLLRLLRYISWLLGLLAGGFIAFNQDFIRLWIGEQFFAGYNINLFVCIGLVISVISSCFGNLCFSMGNIKGNSFISFVQSILYVPLVVFGTIHFGLIGVVAAPVISTLLTSFWYFPMSFMKIMKIPIDSQKIIFWDFSKVAILTFLLTSIFSTVEIFNWTSFVLYTSGFGTSYFLSLGLISKEFRSELKIVLKRIRLKT
jgi:O-antigen/teichoic acid export membrane protein